MAPYEYLGKPVTSLFLVTVSKCVEQMKWLLLLLFLGCFPTLRSLSGEKPWKLNDELNKERESRA